MKWLEDASRMANQMAMDTCRAGEMIAGGVFGLGGAIRTGQWGRCAGIGNATGSFSDFIEAWRGCAEDLTSGATAATGDDRERATPQGNLVWRGLNKLNLPDDMKELIMSTMGTIITGTENNINKVVYKAPLLTPQELVNGVQVNVVSSYPALLGRSYIEQQSESLAILSASYWFDMRLRYTLQAIYQVALEGKESYDIVDRFLEDSKKFYDVIYRELDNAGTKLKNFDTVLQTLDFLEKRTTEGLESKGILAQYNFAKDVRVETR
jgi:hypothetical protein